MSIMMHARTRESVARQRLACTLMQGTHFHPAIASPKPQLNYLALQPCNAARQLALEHRCHLLTILRVRACDVRSARDLVGDIVAVGPAPHDAPLVVTPPPCHVLVGKLGQCITRRRIIIITTRIMIRMFRIMLMRVFHPEGCAMLALPCVHAHAIAAARLSALAVARSTAFRRCCMRGSGSQCAIKYMRLDTKTMGAAPTS